MRSFFLALSQLPRLPATSASTAAPIQTRSCSRSNSIDAASAIAHRAIPPMTMPPAPEADDNRSARSMAPRMNRRFSVADRSS